MRPGAGLSVHLPCGDARAMAWKGGELLVQIIVTTQGKVYVRILALRKTFFYHEVEEGYLEPCSPPPPGNLALAQVEQRTF